MIKLVCDICNQPITVDDMMQRNNMILKLNSPFECNNKEHKQLFHFHATRIDYIPIRFHKSCMIKLMADYENEVSKGIKKMNAKVTQVFIGKHQGIVTAKIYFDLADGTSQATSHKNLGDRYLADFISAICDVFEVENIYHIVGKPCIIQGTDTHIDNVSNFMKPKTYTF